MSDAMRNDRKKRIRFLKRLILSVLAAAILLPTAVSIVLGVRVHFLRRELSQMQKALEAQEAAMTAQTAGDAAQTPDIEAQGELTEEDSIRTWESEAKPAAGTYSGLHKVYLTFDDGPSIYTDEILDILKEYDVKATFFVVGKDKAAYEGAYRRILEEGHTLGMHSYSHAYQEIYSSKEAFIRDVNELSDYLHEVTGKYPDIYRFPGGSSNRVSTVDIEELKEYLTEIGVTWYDWNVSSGDATGHLSKEKIIQNCTTGLENYGEAVILLHDAADKKSTVEALPEMIETILEMEDTVIVPITADTIPIQHKAANS